jgi:hypothetical protein
MWVMVGIALIFMVFRFACKRLSGKRFFVDDYILTFAWVSIKTSQKKFFSLRIHYQFSFGNKF